MGKVKKILMVMVIGAVVSTLIIQPTDAQAGSRRRGHSFKYSGHHHGHHYETHHYPSSFSFVFNSFPKRYITLRVGGSKYYYQAGIYYQKKHFKYYPVPAPVGACIAVLPYGYEIVTVDGYPFYVYNGAYYKHTPQGYVVVNNPYPMRGKNNGQLNTVATVSTDDIITLNIPNAQGGYTTVILKRSGDGFIGPQGEYYKSFPKIKQLITMYSS